MRYISIRVGADAEGRAASSSASSSSSSFPPATQHYAYGSVEQQDLISHANVESDHARGPFGRFQHWMRTHSAASAMMILLVVLSSAAAAIGALMVLPSASKKNDVERASPAGQMSERAWDVRTDWQGSARSSHGEQDEEEEAEMIDWEGEQEAASRSVVRAGKKQSTYVRPAWSSSAFAVNDTAAGSSNTTAPKHCGQCTLTQCKDYFHCNPTATPFACVKGPSVGGCSEAEKAFTENPLCEDCCSLKGCSSMVPKCGSCSATQCKQYKAACGVKRPFVCLDGSSKNGCSDKASNWESGYFNGLCTKCCDLSTCEDEPGCGDCSETECKTFQTSCDTTRPYVCSGGASQGGCAATEQFWKDAEAQGTCNKCCDTKSCFKKAAPASNGTTTATNSSSTEGESKSASDAETRTRVL